MTKQYMQFNEFKTLLFEAIDNEKAAWMGGIFWTVLTSGSTHSLLLYYAVLRNNSDPSIEKSTEGLLEKCCNKLCLEGGVPGNVTISFSPVNENYKHKNKYKLCGLPGALVSTISDLEKMKNNIKKELDSFLMNQKIFVGFEMTERILGLSSPIKNESEGLQGAIASVKRMAEKSDSFGGWSRVKDNLKKMADMPALDFFLEYGDNFLGALAFKAVAGLVKLATKKRGTTSSSSGTGSGGSSGGGATPSWKSSFGDFDVDLGKDGTINLKDQIENYASDLTLTVSPTSSEGYYEINGTDFKYNFKKPNDFKITFKIEKSGMKPVEKEIKIHVK